MFTFVSERASFRINCDLIFISKDVKTDENGNSDLSEVNNLIDIIPTVQKFGFQRDERTQWNKFLNEFLVFCSKEGLAESDNLPARFQ